MFWGMQLPKYNQICPNLIIFAQISPQCCPNLINFNNKIFTMNASSPSKKFLGKVD